MSPVTDNPRLPIGPFREWLLRQEAILGDVGVLARRLEVSPKTLYGWTRRRDTSWVTLDSVDAAGVAYGQTLLLRELYPETYDLPEWVDGDEVAA